jgi:hypothetical protein
MDALRNAVSSAAVGTNVSIFLPPGSTYALASASCLSSEEACRLVVSGFRLEVFSMAEGATLDGGSATGIFLVAEDTATLPYIPGELILTNIHIVGGFVDSAPASSTIHAGAVKIVGSRASLTDCSITDSHVRPNEPGRMPAGGALGAVGGLQGSGSAYVTLTRCVISDCTAAVTNASFAVAVQETCGGGLSFQSDCAVVIDACAISRCAVLYLCSPSDPLACSGNSIAKGGGLHVATKGDTTSASVTITGTIIDSCNASSTSGTSAGGGLFVTRGGYEVVIVTFSDSVVTNCRVFDGGRHIGDGRNLPVLGGGIFVESGSLELGNGAKVYSNFAISNAGVNLTSHPQGQTISGQNLYLQGGEVFYRLPVPHGHWVPAGKCVMYREACSVFVDPADQAACNENDAREACGVDTDDTEHGSGTEHPCPTRSFVHS